jgi:hypothetical protein
MSTQAEAFLFAPGQRSENAGVWVSDPTAKWRVDVWRGDNRLVSYNFTDENQARGFHTAYACALSDVYGLGLAE